MLFAAVQTERMEISFKTYEKFFAHGEKTANVARGLVRSFSCSHVAPFLQVPVTSSTQIAHV